jgi:hypothetical protein
MGVKMVRKYSFAFTIYHIFLLVVAFFLTSLLIVVNKFHPILLILPSLSIFIVVLVFLTAGKTAVELSEEGLKIHFMIRLGNILFSKEVPRFVRWNEIQGMIVCYTRFGETSYGKSILRSLVGEEKIAKIFFKISKGIPKYFFIPFKNFKQSDGEQLLDNLREKIPNLTNKNDVFSDFLRNIVLPSKLQYKKYTLLQEEGIKHPNGIIPWNKIASIDYADFSSRMVNVLYQRQTDSFENIMIKPEGTEDFKNFIQYLIMKSDNASIDASLLKIFSKEYKIEKLAIALVLILIIGFFIYILIGVILS